MFKTPQCPRRPAETVVGSLNRALACSLSIPLSNLLHPSSTQRHRLPKAGRWQYRSYHPHAGAGTQPQMMLNQSLAIRARCLAVLPPPSALMTLGDMLALATLRDRFGPATSVGTGNFTREGTRCGITVEKFTTMIQHRASTRAVLSKVWVHKTTSQRSRPTASLHVAASDASPKSCRLDLDLSFSFIALHPGASACRRLLTRIMQRYLTAHWQQ